MKKRHKPQPRFVTIVRPLSAISWFNHLIGDAFEILEMSKYGSVKIEHITGMYGWVPLECCESHYFLPEAIDTSAQA